MKGKKIKLRAKENVRQEKQKKKKKKHFPFPDTLKQNCQMQENLVKFSSAVGH